MKNIGAQVKSDKSPGWLSLSALLFVLVAGSACVVDPYPGDYGGPPGPAYGYDYGVSPYPWYTGVDIDIGRGYGRGGDWHGRGGGWHGGGRSAGRGGRR